MPLTDVTTIVFAWGTLLAWYASRPSSMSVTYSVPPGTVHVHVFLYVGPWYEPGPTEAPRAALTWAWVRSEQASSVGAAVADGAVAAPTMKMAAITAPRLILQGMV